MDPGAAVNAVSGAIMVLLAVGILVAGPRKDWNRVFALLSAFWGVEIVCLNLVGSAPSAAAALLLGRVGFAFLLPVYFFLAYFAAIFPRPRGPLARSALAVSALALPAAVAVVALLVRPDLVVQGVRPLPDGSFTMLWGPLNPWVGVLPLYAALLYALFTMMRRLDEAESSIERKQITFVLAALAVLVAYASPVYLGAFARAAAGLGGASEAARAESAVFALVMLLSLALVGVLLARLAQRVRAPPPAGREARNVLAAVGVAAAGGLAVAVVEAATGAVVELVGVVRLVSVALVVYAIARWQLFDLDLRVKQGAAVAAAAVAGVTVAAVLWLLLQEVRVTGALGGALAAGVALAAFVPLLRASYRIADRLAPAVSRDGGHLYLRKLEVYRASVETALREGREPRADDPWLAELRGRLALTERDHGVVVSLASTRAEPAQATPDLRAGGVAFGRYEIVSLLAEGGFGRVFLARDRILGRQVVVKELLAKWRGSSAVAQALLREARIAGQLNHPNVVAVYDVLQNGADSYLVMEYAPGGSLQQRLAASGTLPPPEARRVARGVLEGLAAAHAQGVVHRDVKPGNVLFGARGEPKLTDFGIARLSDGEPQDTISALTGGGFQPGTLQWMSPEQARGRPVDARSDVYAVGALLYRMLAGRPHVDVAGLDELAARQAVADAKPPPAPPGVPPALHAAVVRALQPDPSLRFASAREFADALADRTT